MVAVHAYGAAAESGEVDYGGTGFDAHAFKLFKPRADLFRGVSSEEAEIERAMTLGDPNERSLEVDGFGLRKGDRADGVFDLGDCGVAQVVPVAEAFS